MVVQATTATVAGLGSQRIHPLVTHPRPQRLSLCAHPSALLVDVSDTDIRTQFFRSSPQCHFLRHAHYMWRIRIHLCYLLQLLPKVGPLLPWCNQPALTALSLPEYDGCDIGTDVAYCITSKPQLTCMSQTMSTRQLGNRRLIETAHIYVTMRFSEGCGGRDRQRNRSSLTCYYDPTARTPPSVLGMINSFQMKD